VKRIDVYAWIFVCLISCIRYFTKARNDLFLARFRGESVLVDGIVVDEPVVSISGVKLLMEVEYIKVGNQTFEDSNKKSLLLLSTQSTEVIRYGDELSFSGVVETPQIIVDKDGSSFDYPHYLGKDDIYYVMKGTAKNVVSEHKGNLIKEYIFDVKNTVVKNVHYLFPKPYSDLAEALTVSGKQALDAQLIDEFNKAGAINIVVLSGFNVTLIVLVLSVSLSLLPLFVSSTIIVCSVIGFAVMAGGSSSIIRASIMSVALVVGKLFGYKVSSLRSLCVAGGLMVMLNPDILLYDPSFQMSFVGMFGIIMLHRKVAKRLRWITSKYRLKDIVAVTIAVQISLAPLILHLFGTFSSVALLSNILLLPVIPLATIILYITMCLSFITPNLAFGLGFVSYILLRYILAIVGLFSVYGFITIKPISSVETLGIYGAYGIIYWYMRMRLRRIRKQPLLKLKDDKNP
jgi:competence protein ComEC